VEHERFMRRALELASSVPKTSPNPRVGAVVVRTGEIVGEGSHRGAGAAHAEVVALGQAGDAARGATLYVSLEPCVHHGRTPPCIPMIVGSGIRFVVAAIEDPDQRVSGRGFESLRERGIEVVTGVLADEARAINRPYLHHRATGRPLITLKLALTLDGRLSAPDGSSRWITGAEARAFVHRRRAEIDAVMTGAGTVLHDDPELTARIDGVERQPARVIVDGRGRVSADARVFADGEVVVATTSVSPHEVQLAWKEAGAEVLVLPEKAGNVDLDELLRALGERGWLEVYCEGGAELATSIIRDKLVDRIEIIHGSVIVGAGGAAIAELGVASMSEAHGFVLAHVESFGDDVLTIYEPRRN
jgi:diaminohydroxyphosphoribosylaminopyrimidine deaminase / 5-amino-6-(5-phosphoribosylamino)uracil reductase